MIVDSSALIAILLDEPEAPSLLAALFDTKTRKIAAPNWLETALVFEGRQTTEETYIRLDELAAEMSLAIVPFDAELAEVARRASRRFGKGRQHKAKLNFGDCIAYALSKVTGEPLLFKGSDFAHTDIVAALA